MSEAIANLSNLKLYNISRSIASDAINIVKDASSEETPDTTSDVDTELLSELYRDAEDEHDYWPFTSPSDLVDVVCEETGVTGNPEEVNEFASTISDRLEAAVGIEESGGDSSTQEGLPVDLQTVADKGDETFTIAADLCYHLLGDGQRSYTAIESDYEVEFPDESVTLTELLNTSGSLSQRAEEIQSWVASWYGGDVSVERKNTKMGNALRLSGD